MLQSLKISHAKIGRHTLLWWSSIAKGHEILTAERLVRAFEILAQECLITKSMHELINWVAALHRTVLLPLEFTRPNRRYRDFVPVCQTTKAIQVITLSTLSWLQDHFQAYGASEIIILLLHLRIYRKHVPWTQLLIWIRCLNWPFTRYLPMFYWLCLTSISRTNLLWVETQMFDSSINEVFHLFW